MPEIQDPKLKKITVTITEGGQTKEIEVEVPDEGDLAWPDQAKTKYLGKPVQRLDGPSKVTGRAKYSYDMVLPDMLYGVFLRSPHARARVTNLDASAAEAHPGVKAVLTNFSREVRFAGQELAAVAAVSEEAAYDAIKLIKVDYEVLPHSASVKVARRQGAPQVGRDESNVREGQAREQGNVDEAFGQAKATVEGEYSVPIRLHASLETHGLVAQWEGDDKVNIWASTQSVFGVRDEIANAMQVSPQNVRVLCDYMGGGFGSKFGARVEGVTAARLARMAKAPVKMMLDRYEEHTASGNGPNAHAKVKAACDAEGKLIAFEATCWGTSGPSSGWGLPMPYIYRVPNSRIKLQTVVTNSGAAAALRAPMHPQASFIMESAMDELAYKAGIDPLKFRIDNDASQVRRGQFELGAEMFGWGKRNPKPGADTGRYRKGMGVGAAQWGGGGGGGSSPSVTIHKNGTVTSRLGTQDLGTGTRTYIAMIVAETLGIPMDRVTSLIGDSQFGFSGGSGGSTTTPSVAPAVKAAAEAAKSQLIGIVATKLKADPKTLKWEDGTLVAGTRRLGFNEACAYLDADGVTAQGRWVGALQGGSVAGCQFAEVEVDTWTGRVKPLRVLAIQDAGYVLNKLALESQIIGGVVQGIGMALTEDRMMDDQTGRSPNPGMEGYKLPGILEMPKIDVHVYENPTGRVSGFAEAPVIPTAAAIANAVYHATGFRVRHLPLTPWRVLEAMGLVEE